MKKTKKWGLYQIYRGSDEYDTDWEEMIPPKFDSLGFFAEKPFVIVRQGSKYGILLNPFEIGDATEIVDCRYDQIVVREKSDEYFTLIQQDDKWGLIDWFEGFMVIEPAFDKVDEVPLIKMDSWMAEIAQNARKALKADLIEFDYGNGDGVFRARNKETKKWGMYQSLESDKPTELIPMEYDSVYFFPFNGNYTAVFKGGKIGFYLSWWTYEDQARQSVPCIYDDYKRYSTEGIPRLAAKRDEYWGWVDWLTGEEMSEFTFESPESLPYPNYEQKVWFDE